MNYELAKELKEAGFPQQRTLCFASKGERDLYLHDHVQLSKHTEDGKWVDMPYAPTLSELIEACGEVTVIVWGCKPHGYYAASQPCMQTFDQLKNIVDAQGEGTTPEEAVARLWLALNKP